MKVIIDDGFDYVPLWNDNRTLPESDQIRVRFHFMSGIELARIMRLSDENEEQLKEDFRSAVASIENLEMEDPETGETRAATVDDIMMLGYFQDLYIELKQEYREQAVVNKKN